MDETGAPLNFELVSNTDEREAIATSFSSTVQGERIGDGPAILRNLQPLKKGFQVSQCRLHHQPSRSRYWVNASRNRAESI
jgi:hypothetical protein